MAGGTTAVPLLDARWQHCRPPSHGTWRAQNQPIPLRTTSHRPARVIIGSNGHRPRSAPQPQAPQRYHRPETSRRHRPWPQAPQRCHRPQAPRLHRLHGPRASQRSQSQPPSALSSAVNSSCKDLAWEASCPSGVTGRGKKKPWEKESSARRRQTTDDRRRQTTPCGVWECCF